MANTTWNPSDKSAGVTLSNGNLTAVTNAGNQSVRAIDRQITGKFYFETTCTTIGANFGIGVQAGYPTLVAGAITSTVMVVSGGALIYINGNSTGISIGTIASGSLLGIAIDITNQLAWFRVGAAGNWNGNASYSPSTGVGGVNFASMGGSGVPFYPYAAINNSGSSITTNFGDTAFTGAVPAGFTSGFTSGVTPALNALASTTFVEHWAVADPAVQLTQAFVDHWVLPNPQMMITQVTLEEWTVPPAPAMQLTNVVIEQWAQVNSINTQMVMTQTFIEEWATVATASTPVSGDFIAAGIGSLNAVGTTVPTSVGGPMVILMM